MKKRMGNLYSVVALFTLITVAFFAAGGCDSDGDGAGDVMQNCAVIEGTSSGTITSKADDNNCISNIEDGCFLGSVSGSLDGSQDTFFLTKETFDMIDKEFTEITGTTLVNASEDDQLLGQLVAIANDNGEVAAGLIQWDNTGSFGKFSGASGYAVLDVTIDNENKTFSATYSGILCTN